MNFTTARNPVMDSFGGILLFVTFDDLGEVPFRASPDDEEEHGRQLFSLALQGKFGPVTSYVPPPYVRHVPPEVTRFQATAALLQAGLLDEIESYMVAPTSDPFTRLAWRSVLVFKRTSPLVASIGSLFGLTDSQIDDLFIFAETIEV